MEFSCEAPSLPDGPSNQPHPVPTLAAGGPERQTPAGSPEGRAVPYSTQSVPDASANGTLVTHRRRPTSNLGAARARTCRAASPLGRTNY
jgi:hypothetical protein